MTGFGPDCRGALYGGVIEGVVSPNGSRMLARARCCQQRSKIRPCGGTGIYHFDWVTSLSAARTAASLRSTCSCATGVSPFAKRSTAYSTDGSFGCLWQLAGNVLVGSTTDSRNLPLPRPLSGVMRKKSARKRTSASESRLLGDKRSCRQHGPDFRLQPQAKAVVDRRRELRARLSDSRPLLLSRMFMMATQAGQLRSTMAR